jgi:hypothetical protein
LEEGPSRVEGSTWVLGPGDVANLVTATARIASPAVFHASSVQGAREAEPRKSSSGSRLARDEVREGRLGQWRSGMTLASPPRSKETNMTILWIVIAVIVVLALLGFFSRGRWGRRGV